MVKKYRMLILLTVLCLQFLQAGAANVFATQRLSQIASQLFWDGWDTLTSAGEYKIPYSARTLNVRVNKWNEIEHIGLDIFGNRPETNGQTVVLDFVERYLLELLLEGTQDAAYARLNKDFVRIEAGLLTDLLSVGKTDEFVMSYLGFKGYKMAWRRAGKVFCAISFPMNYELLSGCNSIELEDKYLRNIQRYALHPDTIEPKKFVPTDTSSCYAFDEGGTYLSGSIRHDLYYENDSLYWTLLSTTTKPFWSAFNIALSDSRIGDFQLECLLDKYGYQTAEFSIPMNEWIAHCEKEGGTPYFGIKSKDSTAVYGTVFVPYEDKGYCHMLKLEIPLSAMDARKGGLKGRLFAYVPLHNLYEGYFDYQFIQRKEGNE